jgi:flagellar hook-associated protein 3 FlgL
MRIGTNQFQENTLYQITNSFARATNAQQQLSTGKRINMPSDDPTGTAQTLSLRNHLDALDQSDKMLNQAKGFLDATDGALNGVTDILRQARTMAVQASSTSLTQEGHIALAGQVQSLIQSLGNIGNTTYGNRYLFAGQRDDTPPFLANGEGFVYRGGTKAGQDSEIHLDVGKEQTLRINVTGEEAIAPILSVLEEFRDRVRAGQTSAISNDSLKKIDTTLQSAVRLLSELGSRTQQVTQALAQNTGAKVNFSRILSDIEDVDIPKAVVELQSAQTAYQAALQSTARIGQISLLDYLR